MEDYYYEVNDEADITTELKAILNSTFPLVRSEVKIGWIGIGKIGTVLASELISDGYDSLYVYNRTVKKTEPLQEWGANLAENIKLITEKCRIIFISVGTINDVNDVFYGKNGLYDNIKPGTIIIDMTTGSPTLARKIYKDCLSKKCFFLDAPIIGSEESIKNRKATIVAGGNYEVFKGVLPVFYALSTFVNYCGPSGNGQNTKLSNQIIISLNMIGMVESLLYAYKSGLDLNVTIHSIALGTGNSWCFSHFSKKIEERDFNSGLL